MLQFLTTELLFPHRFKLLFTEVPKKDVQRFKKKKTNKQTSKHWFLLSRSSSTSMYIIRKYMPLQYYLKDGIA